jgi:rubrerythrin
VTDRRVVEGLLRLEWESVALYRGLAQKLTGRPAATARHFLAQERRHVDSLQQALRSLKAPLPRAAPSRPDLQGGQRALIRTAIDHELTCIRAYDQALATLQAPAVLGGVAGTMANEAQHLAVLRQLLGEDPAPVAFVKGR